MKSTGGQAVTEMMYGMGDVRFVESLGLDEVEALDTPLDDIYYVEHGYLGFVPGPGKPTILYKPFCLGICLFPGGDVE